MNFNFKQLPHLRKFLREGGLGSAIKTPDVEAHHLPDPAGTRPTPFAHVQHNVNYVLIAMAFSANNDEVLLIQEARKLCLGLWYPPSTKLEPKEKLVDHLKKQMVLMTGLDIEPQTLMSLESQGGRWHRLAFLVKVVGGKLKTRTDEHSQQAQWVPVRSVLEGKTGMRFRSEDVIVLVSRAADNIASVQAQTHAVVLPTDFPHGCLNCRLVLVRQKLGKVAVVVSRSGYQLPVLRYPPRSLGMGVITEFFQKAFGEDNVKYRYCGVVAIEHSPSFELFRRTDGMCTTLIAKVESSSDYVLDFEKGSDYKWLVVDDEEVSRELNAIVDGRVTLPFFRLVANKKESQM